MAARSATSLTSTPENGQRLAAYITLTLVEAQLPRVVEVLTECAELHMDLAHRDVERRLAHLR